MIGEDSFVLPEDFDTEEIDIFAELGVSNSHKVNLQNTQEVSAELSILLEKEEIVEEPLPCLLYTSPSPRDRTRSRMPSSA